MSNQQHWFESCPDEYWNSSSTTAFSFEEEDFNFTPSSTSTITNQVKSKNEDNAKNLTQLASDLDQKLNFKLIDSNLAEQQLNLAIKDQTNTQIKINYEDEYGKQDLNNSVVARIEQKSRQRKFVNEFDEVINKLFLNIDCNLNKFKKKSEKLALIDKAIEFGDGNVIIICLLFLRSTLSEKIFLNELLTRKVAINHLIAYFTKTKQIQQLIDLLTFVGRYEEAAIYKFEQAINHQSSVKIKIDHLKSCKRNYFSNLNQNNFDLYNSFLTEYIDLLERQQPIEFDDSKKVEQLIKSNEQENLIIKIPRKCLLNMSTLSTLYYCCLYHFNLTENHFASPKAITKQYNINQKQYLWTALRALASASCWTEINSLFEQKSWLGGSRVNSAISFDKVAKVLHENHAPVELITKYLKLIDDNYQRLELLKEFKFYYQAIDLYASLRDRKGLEQYNKCLTPGSDEEIYSRTCLCDPNIRWKN